MNQHDIIFNTNWATTTIILFATITVILIVLAYLLIYRVFSKRLTFFLMSLRIVAVALLLLCLIKPTLVSHSTITERGKLIVMADTSRSMSLPIEEQGPNRLEQVQQFLASELVANLGQKNDLATYVFADNSQRLTTPLLSIEGDHTDISSSVSRAVSALKGQPLAGVLLLTDGGDNSGIDPVKALEPLATPIYALGVGTHAGEKEKNIALTEVMANRRVIVNNEIQVECEIQNQGYDKLMAPIEIHQGDEVVASTRVRLMAYQKTQRAVLNFAPSVPGDFIYTVSVPIQAGETSKKDNRQEFPLHVSEGQIKVLYLDGVLRWEFKFLRRTLKSDPDISLIALVRVGKKIVFSGTGGGNPVTLRGKIFTDERLKDIDVVILGDIESSYFSQKELQNLVKFVDRDGGSVVMLGGYDAFGAGGYKGSPLERIMPVVFAPPKASQAEGAFAIKLTEAGKNHPIFQFTEDVEQNALIWESLPKLDGCSQVLRAKPGARILAVNPTTSNLYGDLIVLAVQKYGAGKTLALTADTTWKWDFVMSGRAQGTTGTGDTLYKMFWGQVIRWLATGEPGKEEPIIAPPRTEKYVYKLGETVTISTKLSDKKPEVKPLQISGAVQTADGEKIDLSFEKQPGETGEYKASFFPTTGGRYYVNLMAKGVDNKFTRGKVKILENRKANLLVIGPELELEESGLNEELLRNIADRTGGKYSSLKDADKLIEDIESADRELNVTAKHEMWNTPWFFGGFLLLMTIEWLIRKRKRME